MDWKEKNARAWEGDEWQDEINAVKDPSVSQSERTRAYISLRQKLMGTYHWAAIKYGRFLEAEGEEVRSFLDHILYNCTRSFIHDIGVKFSTFFFGAIFNEISALRKHRKFLERTNQVSVELDHTVACQREVAHDLIAEIGKLLTPIQRRVLDMKLAGYQDKEIQKKLFLNRYYLGQNLVCIRQAAKECMEVKNG